MLQGVTNCNIGRTDRRKKPSVEVASKRIKPEYEKHIVNQLNILTAVFAIFLAVFAVFAALHRGYRSPKIVEVLLDLIHIYFCDFCYLSNMYIIHNITYIFSNMESLAILNMGDNFINVTKGH